MEEKIKEDFLVRFLILEKGYNQSDAERAVEDVLEARREAREYHLKEYVGKRVRAEFGGLLFEVVVKDVKIDQNGKPQFQVTPLNGSKMAWVERITL